MCAFFLNVNAQKNFEKEKAETYLSTKGEITFTFQIENEADLEMLTHNMSLVHYDSATKTVKAWANTEQFRQFEQRNIPFNVPKNENEVSEADIYDVRPLASRSTASTLSFPLSSYPTYAEYAQQMQDFEDDYPTLVEKVSIGNTVQGDKELLFVKISDNVSTDEQEPKLMLTSSMHGDEIAGYPMMLTLIDYILTVYNDTGHSDHARVANLVENAEIWINPNANPDGTYHNSSSNTSVTQARRGNANNIDLNRNYPDNIAGPHDDGEAYQAETLAFMALADAHNFVISANFHGGTELVNYPFDNAYPSQHEHADTEWFEHIGVEYATHCQIDANAGSTSTPSYSNKSSYMTDDDDWDGSPSYYMQSPGVTHGAEWYRVYGGRQDYMNYYQNCREVTIELSDQKILQESLLDDYWYYNRDAILDFLTQGTYGFRGLVKDANTTNPIEDVKVTVVGHDAFNSEIYTDNHGAYYRPIKGGTYSLLFEAPCYQSVTVSSQSISDGNTVVLSDVLMTPLTPTVPSSLNASAITTSSATLGWVSTGSTFDLRFREVGNPTWTDVMGLTSNSYNISGLNIDTEYEFQVRAICGALTSAYSTSFSFTTSSVTYCNSQGNNTNFFYIDRVQLNTIDNNNSGAQGYGDFTNMSTTLVNDVTYTITVSPEYTGSSYNVGYRVWIDFDKDGTFSTAERILNRAPTQNASVSASFTVPNTVTNGNTRMRVSMKYNARPSACETFTYGEVEDYTINLFDGLVYSSNTWIPNAPSSSTSSEDVLVEDGTYNVNTDISLNNLRVNSGAVINVDKTSNVNVAGSIINFGEFILNSDSNEFSSLIVDGTVTGPVKYNRHVTSNAGGNDIIAPPVSGESFTSFISNNPNILSNSTQTLYLFGPFEKPLNDYAIFSNSETATLDAGTGYRAASTDDGTFTFEGAVTTGTLNVPIVKTGSDFDKWNLIGNPYTSYIKLSDFLAENINEMDSQSVAVYGYDANISDGSVWTIWNMSYSDANPGALIAPGQGFFVTCKDGGASVTFDPSMQQTGNTDDFILGRNANYAHFVLRMESSDKAYETDLYLKDVATLGLDVGYDAEIFQETPSPFMIYTELTENNTPLPMAIQSIGFDDVNGSTLIPLGVNALQGDQVNISLNTENIEYNVYLEDTVENSSTLLNTSAYNFTAESDMVGTGRFYLRFEAETLSVESSALNEVNIYSDANVKQIVVSGLLKANTMFTLYDIHGRALVQKALDSNAMVNTIDTSSYANGVYLVQLSDQTTTISKKLIIR